MSKDTPEASGSPIPSEMPSFPRDNVPGGSCPVAERPLSAKMLSDSSLRAIDIGRHWQTVFPDMKKKKTWQ